MASTCRPASHAAPARSIRSRAWSRFPAGSRPVLGRERVGLPKGTTPRVAVFLVIASNLRYMIHYVS
jgi:hypothetical protein